MESVREQQCYSDYFTLSFLGWNIFQFSKKEIPESFSNWKDYRFARQEVCETGSHDWHWQLAWWL